MPNPWITEHSWLNRTDVTFQVPYRDFTLSARMYDILVTGYGNRTNKLHLFDVDTVDESLVTEGISFDKTDIKKNLTLFLYPDDSDDDGRILRIYQQYFMVSCAAQLILKEGRGQGQQFPRSAGLRRGSDQRHPSHHGDSGADPPAHRGARNGDG